MRIGQKGQMTQVALWTLSIALMAAGVIFLMTKMPTN